MMFGGVTRFIYIIVIFSYNIIQLVCVCVHLCVCWQDSQRPKCSQKSFKKRKTGRDDKWSAPAPCRDTSVFIRRCSRALPLIPKVATRWRMIPSTPLQSWFFSLQRVWRIRQLPCLFYFFFSPRSAVSFSIINLAWETWLYFISVTEKSISFSFSLTSPPRCRLSDVTLELM